MRRKSRMMISQNFRSLTLFELYLLSQWSVFSNLLCKVHATCSILTAWSFIWLCTLVLKEISCYDVPFDHGTEKEDQTIPFWLKWKVNKTVHVNNYTFTFLLNPWNPSFSGLLTLFCWFSVNTVSSLALRDPGKLILSNRNHGFSRFKGNMNIQLYASFLCGLHEV